MSEIVLTDSNFEKEVVEGSKAMPVLVDFWASWCPPCRIMGPLIDELARDYQDRIKVGKYSVEEGAVIAEKMGVQSIPAFFLYKDGKVVDQWTGAMPKDDVAKKIEKALVQ
jgi:thioredoxin 1